MIVAIIPFLVCVVGLLLWALASNAVVQDAGRWMFVCGLLVSLFVVARHTIHLG